MIYRHRKGAGGIEPAPNTLAIVSMPPKALRRLTNKNDGLHHAKPHEKGTAPEGRPRNRRSGLYCQIMADCITQNRLNVRGWFAEASTALIEYAVRLPLRLSHRDRHAVFSGHCHSPCGLRHSHISRERPGHWWTLCSEYNARNPVRHSRRPPPLIITDRRAPMAAPGKSPNPGRFMRLGL